MLLTYLLIEFFFSWPKKKNKNTSGSLVSSCFPAQQHYISAVWEVNANQHKHFDVYRAQLSFVISLGLNPGNSTLHRCQILEDLEAANAHHKDVGGWAAA